MEMEKVSKKMSGPLGLKMGDEEAMEYLSSLLKADRDGLLRLGFLERQCFDELKTVIAELAEGGQRLNTLKAQAASLEAVLQSAIGRRKAYSQLLVTAEEARRNAERADLELVKGDVKEPQEVKP